MPKKKNKKKFDDCDSGLGIIDIRVPSKPKLVSSVITQGDPQGIAISGNYAYVTGSGLEVISVANISNPTSVRLIDIPGAALQVAISGNYAYVAADMPSLQIVDITMPRNATLFKNVKIPGQAYDVTVSKNYAYVAAVDGMQVVNIATPSKPVWVGGVNVPGAAAVSVAVSGNYAYVADSRYGLQIIDVSKPHNVTRVGSVGLPGSADDVVISGNYAFVTTWGSGLQVVDIATPSNPVIIGNYDNMPDGAYGVAVSNNYAYVLDGYGLQILNTTSLELLGRYSLTVEDPVTESIVVRGNYAYFAGGCFSHQVRNKKTTPLLTLSEPDGETTKTHKNSKNTFLRNSEIIAIKPTSDSQVKFRIRDLKSTTLPDKNSALVETTQMSSASSLRDSLALMPYNFLKDTINGFLDRICDAIGSYAADVARDCPSYFPPNNPHYWTANTTGTMFSESKLAIASNATLIAPSQSPNLLN